MAGKAHEQGKLVALHASEAAREDIDAVLDLRPDFLVHMVEVQPDPDILALASTPRRYFPPPDAAADEESVDWLAVMAKAETSVPD